MSELRKVVLASRNPDKVRELREVFDGLPFAVVASSDYPGLPDVIEDGTTILGNATRKALVTAAYTGEIALADDTSLQVRELHGWPDIFAARFAGPAATYADNAQLTLDLLRDVPDGLRQARFATACCWIDPRPELVSYSVRRPATRRWLRNPWADGSTTVNPDEAADFWNSVWDRNRVWHDYTALMMTDLVSHGHDRQRLREVAAQLLTPADSAAGVRLPDSRIWAVTGPDTTESALTSAAPFALPASAPGRAVNDGFWLEIASEGRLVGDITREALGAAGFGYDPIFRPAGHSQTLAEMEPPAKNAISHRGRAVRRLMKAVRLAYGWQSSV